MRVTFNAIQGNLDAINAAASQLAHAQQMVSSGKRVLRPSDDPLSAERAIQDQSDIGTIDAYSQASDSATARLSVLDGALSSMTDILTTALATATGAHGDTPDQISRDTASVKLQGLREALAGALNTQFRGVYVFSGSQAQSKPYDNSTGAWVYGGDGAPVTVDTAHNRAVTMAMDGQAIAKGADANDILTEMDTLATAIQTGNNAGVQTGIDALNRAFTRVTKAQSQVGTDEDSIADGQAQLTTLRLAGTQRLSSDQDANMAEAITQMSHAQTAYQAALSAVGTATKQSLLDYLR
jgi:flagellar hook-associated protein 3 FlgL